MSLVISRYNNDIYTLKINRPNEYNALNTEVLIELDKKLDTSDDILSYCGLNNENENFDLGGHLLKCLGEFDEHKENKQPIGK